MIKNSILYLIMISLILLVGFVQSWNVALLILNMCIISSIMSLGVNIQYGYAGLFNLGIMGFVALGGLATVIISAPPVYEAWDAGGIRIIFALSFGALTIFLATYVWKLLKNSRYKSLAISMILILGFFIYRFIFDPAVEAIEKINPATEGYLGGLGLPIILSWPVGGLLAAIAAWMIGKISLGLRSDYLAIATIGVSEIIIFTIKNEDWLARGVKNVIGLPRPVPYEIDLQQNANFIYWSQYLGMDVVDASSIFVKLCYSLLFILVLIILYWLCEKALKSPWGRMMRAIRDNEVAAEAMGKDVKSRHLQVFILGSAVCGIAGAMLVTLDGQLTPTNYHPLRFTFIIWVMVILGGAGNNLGSILGGFIIWFFWVEVEYIGLFLMDILTSGFADDNAFRIHMLNSAAYMRYLTLGLILVLVLRFNPRGLIPEK
ncbi:MAG: branched-chain amino acid ABC transporter permease [Alphaproteobacteria bacterium]|nr:branched-chain amino acid ABC transporter permease [SAR116 cluster bacterium]GIR78799.1 MAG: branched-chain amino acid ABC transporter permease [Alphaproteobacteria bacterium]